MKPADRTRVWRKTGRAATKRIPTGRRTTHRVETQTPKPRSTWEQLLNRRNTSDGA
jgi:hypothetical protein